MSEWIKCEDQMPEISQWVIVKRVAPSGAIVPKLTRLAIDAHSDDMEPFWANIDLPAGWKVTEWRDLDCPWWTPETTPD